MGLHPAARHVALCSRRAAFVILCILQKSGIPLIVIFQRAASETVHNNRRGPLHAHALGFPTALLPPKYPPFSLWGILVRLLLSGQLTEVCSGVESATSSNNL